MLQGLHHVRVTLRWPCVTLAVISVITEQLKSNVLFKCFRGNNTNMSDPNL